MKKLMEEARKAYDYSYAPYSGIRIGACVEGKSGKIYTGCNVENASYGATLCAERCAVGKAVSAGETGIVAVAVTGDIDDYAYPCGICRQVLSEFMEDDARILVGGKDRENREFTAGELLPNGFTHHRHKGE